MGREEAGARRRLTRQLGGSDNKSDENPVRGIFVGNGDNLPEDLERHPYCSASSRGWVEVEFLEHYHAEIKARKRMKILARPDSSTIGARANGACFIGKRFWIIGQPTGRFSARALTLK